MSDDEPIELPGLSAQRREPTAAVCATGHVLSWFVDPTLIPEFCPKCGDPVLVACPSCNRPLPPDGEMLQWVPYHGNCMYCGQPYPWKADEILRAKRTIAEQAEVEHWEPAVKARAEELVDDIAADRATSSDVDAAVRWLDLHGGGAAVLTIIEAVERLGGVTLRQALRANFPGRF